MIEINQQFLLFAFGLALIVIGIQSFLAIYMTLALKFSSRDRAAINKEIFGLVKRLEGLTASRQEQMVRHYDRMLEQLSQRLPPTIAHQTKQVIFDTESKILSRLAELEPSLKNDAGSRKKMDELIRSMESLEQTVVSLTAETVEKVMVESRRDLFDDPRTFTELSS